MKEILKKIRFQNSFEPNLTTEMLYQNAKLAVSKLGLEQVRLLEVGCGCGIISLMLSLEFEQRVKLSLSDLSAGAIQDAKDNFRDFGVPANIKVSDVLGSWKGEKFDLVINDISGVSKTIADMSPWFKNAPAAQDENGTELLLKFTHEAKSCLADGGLILFPILSLSRHEAALDIIARDYNIELLQEVEWPLPEDLVKNELFHNYCKQHDIMITERFEMYLGSTKIFIGVLHV